MITAWFASRLAGPLAQAIAAASAVLVLVTAIVLGLAWVRNDARQDERAALELKQHRAQALEMAKAWNRQARAQQLAAQAQEAYAAELGFAQVRIEDLEQRLATRARVVCYPKNIVRTLNK
jgi:hypothetical protein